MAPLMAARRSMRVYDHEVGRFDSARALTTKRPRVPAAVPLFKRGRTRLLALDFDAKHLGPRAVQNDVARVLKWLDECGGRPVVDVSTSGGQHVLIPLSPGSSATVDEIRPVLDLLAARLPTLDIVPMTNESTGCITVPGSECREGGHRRLVDDLAAAIDSLVVGSDAGLLARLTALLGRAPQRASHRSNAVSTVVQALTMSERIVGTGKEACLHPAYRRSLAPSPSVVAFATRGRLDRDRWQSRSEARQSVLAHAVMGGSTITQLLEQAETSEWAGLRAAYSGYRDPAKALIRDAENALKWLASTLPDPVRHTGHKFKYTGGVHDPTITSWLLAANAWTSSHYSGRRDRWSTHAVLQALAWSAAVAGEIVEGTPLVAVGGRSLSIAAGMLPETTVWSVLERLRDTAGSPVLLVARGAGQNADRYALVPAAPLTSAETTSASGNGELGGLESVHPAWSEIGLRQKAVYDTVTAADEPLSVDALIETLGMSRSSGYDAILDLRIAGLLTVVNGLVTQGRVSLDDIARRCGMDVEVRRRVVRHRAERIVWHQWLIERENARLTVGDDRRGLKPDPGYLSSVVASGPTGDIDDW